MVTISEVFCVQRLTGLCPVRTETIRGLCARGTIVED
jgi:hypothetical protein